MEPKKLTRRELLRYVGLAASAGTLAACAPKVVEKIVKETVVVERVVKEVVKETIIVAGTPQVVEKEVTKIVKEVLIATPAPKEAVVLDFMNRAGDFIHDVIDKQAAAFNEIYPDIKIHNETVPGSHREALLMRIAAGTAPDAWFGSGRHMGFFWHKGVTVNMEPFLEAEPTFDEDDYVSEAWFTQTFDNARWGLPWDSGAMALYFDMDLFDEAGVPYLDPKRPVTWDEMVEIGTRLTLDANGKHPGESGFDPARIRQYGYLYAGMFSVWSCIYSNGGEFFASDYTCPIDTPEAIEAVDWLADLGLKHFISPSIAYPQTEMVDIRSKNVAIQYNGVWALGRVVEAGVRFGIAPFPMSKVQTSYGHYSPLCITTMSKHQKEAFTWIYWACCSYEGEKMLVDFGLQQPIRKDLGDYFVNTPEPPESKYRQVFVDMLDSKVFRCPGDTMDSYFNGYRSPMHDVVNPAFDPVWAGTVKYEEVASDIRKKLEIVLRTGEVT